MALFWFQDDRVYWEEFQKLLHIYRIHGFFLKVEFPVSRNFYVRTCVKLPLGNKIGAIHERSLASVKFEPPSNPRLSSAHFILPLFYLRD